MHKAKAVVIMCMDFRFQNKVQEFLKQNNYLGKCDEIIVAGATRDFIKPVNEKYGEYVWRQLELSVKLHDPDEIVFIDHQDCGGYALDGLIQGGQDMGVDMSMHKDIQKELEEVVKSKYPSKTVKFYYASLDENIVQSIS